MHFMQLQVWGQHAAWHWGASSSGIWADLCKYIDASEVTSSDVKAAQDVICQTNHAENELLVQRDSFARCRDV